MGRGAREGMRTIEEEKLEELEAFGKKLLVLRKEINDIKFKKPQYKGIGLSEVNRHLNESLMHVQEKMKDLLWEIYTNKHKNKKFQKI